MRENGDIWMCHVIEFTIEHVLLRRPCDAVCTTWPYLACPSTKLTVASMQSIDKAIALSTIASLTSNVKTAFFVMDSRIEVAR